MVKSGLVMKGLRPIDRVIEEGSGAVFIPLVLSYSARISSVSPGELGKSHVRAVSLYRAFEYLGYDGIVCDLDPKTSLDSSGDLGREEVDEGGLSEKGSIRTALETAEKLSLMLRDRGGELLCVIYGPSYLSREFSRPVNDLYLAIDNLAVLARRYLDSGCTAILIIESEISLDSIEAYGSLKRLAELYGAHTALLSLSSAVECEGTSLDVGFDFAWPIEGGANPCIPIDLTSEEAMSTTLSLVINSKENKPTLVTTMREISDIDVGRFRELVKLVRDC